MILTSKQRAYLRGLANRMEPILHAGKGGVSDAMIKQADDALEARELIKGKVLETAPATAREVAEDIAARVNAQVVQVVGRTFVLFRQKEKESDYPAPFISREHYVERRGTPCGRWRCLAAPLTPSIKAIFLWPCVCATP